MDVSHFNSLRILFQTCFDILNIFSESHCVVIVIVFVVAAAACCCFVCNCFVTVVSAFVIALLLPLPLLFVQLPVSLSVTRLSHGNHRKFLN